jgi:hypothetical protein
MEIVKFDKVSIEEKQVAIEEVKKMLEESTSFVFLCSKNNLNTTNYYDFNLSNIEAITILEALKHVYLHKILPNDYDDDDPNKKEIPLCAVE